MSLNQHTRFPVLGAGPPTMKVGDLFTASGAIRLPAVNRRGSLTIAELYTASSHVLIPSTTGAFYRPSQLIAFD